jgi:hypothetical protein
MRRDRPNHSRRSDEKKEPKYAGIFPFLFHEYKFFETIFAKLGQLPQKSPVPLIHNQKIKLN